jgi:hypothetical protein
MRLPVESVEKGDCDGGDEREEEKERAVEAKPCQNRQSVACALAGPERHGNASARGQRRGRGSSWSRGCREGRGASALRRTKGGRGGEERPGDSGRGNGAEEEARADKAWWSKNQGRTPKISNRQSSSVNYLPQANYPIPRDFCGHMLRQTRETNP